MLSSSSIGWVGDTIRGYCDASSWLKSSQSSDAAVLTLPISISALVRGIIEVVGLLFVPR